VPLSEILAVDTAKKPTGDVMHCFEIRTANVDFFVGEDNVQVWNHLLTNCEKERISLYRLMGLLVIQTT
jgi:hypothetical protein